MVLQRDRETRGGMRLQKISYWITKLTQVSFCGLQF